MALAEFDFSYWSQSMPDDEQFSCEGETAGLVAAQVLPVYQNSCDLGYSFPSPVSLSGPSNEHSSISPNTTPSPGEKSQRFRCPKCPKTFRRTSDKNKHVSKVHKRSFPCTMNGCKAKSFGSGYDLARHKDTVHVASKKRFSCLVKECPSEFSRKDNMVKHMKKLHSHSEVEDNSSSSGSL
ncbi:hypothetical protein BCR34DRAFT_669575 [Clohesyomyces aquaticus]|uniref:C2H2-type domain-containing protein n=1 Tax=Clohesyomyces aquaticus TaxID=1231657 RepID=A0A1Y1YAE0_9PLEO|nr:hypothetical protein BCR34DRAFT_669575 [Clohesyomyces aquaticus]